MAIYHFTEKHRWALKNHLMTGITLRPWLRLLWEFGPEVDWLRYAGRILFLTAAAAVNSCFGLLDTLLYGRQVAAQQLHPEPVFILGHPRTGTTHLHNLLSLDDQFAFASIFQAGFPSSFLAAEWVKPLLAPVMDSTRPMDAMRISFETPAEDEIATNVLSGGVSPYAPIVFMRSWREFSRFYTFEEASPAELEAWTSCFMRFLKKVTFRHGHTKPLLIKSPVHTARVALLLRLFPRAKFIYIHRHPLEVFQSAAHMADTYYWYCYLQRPSDAEVTEFILEQGLLLHQAYMRDRALVPPGNLVEVSFSELDADAVATMERVYERLGWAASFERMRPLFQRYCSSLADFKKNDLRRLPPDLEALVRQRWAPLFSEYDYT